VFLACFAIFQQNALVVSCNRHRIWLPLHPLNLQFEMGLKKRNTSSNMPRVVKKAINQICDSCIALKFSRKKVLSVKKHFSEKILQPCMKVCRQYRHRVVFISDASC